MAALYHEKQVAALCGVHCINTLLQGPIFSEVDLAHLAHELDALEKAVMQEGGLTGEDYAKFVSEESGNVAADGMFSIQVLSRALEVWGLSVTPLSHPDMRDARAEPQREAAFICNLQEHWFTVRRLGSDWWNFNSLFPAPQLLGSFYLSAFLASLEQQGYQIFVVRGELPAPQPRPELGEDGGPGRWLSPDEARAANADAEGARKKGRLANALEDALSAAAAAGGSMQLRPKRGRSKEGDPPDESGNGGSGGDAYDEDLAAAIAASLSHAGAGAGIGMGPAFTGGGIGTAGVSAGASSGSHGGVGNGGRGGFSGRGGGGGGEAPMEAATSSGGGVGGSDDDEADLAAAITASLAYQHAPGSGGTYGNDGCNGSGNDGGGALDAPPVAQLSPFEPLPPVAQLVPFEPLPEEPPAGEGAVQLAFRMPSGG
mmetsp:Transcript_7872/g.23710  ORF Transcript_7872/g.23710 Transcript_7872/m.23710 type:complete len:429 (-) Transcript_7872:479-1765(-)